MARILTTAISILALALLCAPATAAFSPKANVPGEAGRMSIQTDLDDAQREAIDACLGPDSPHQRIEARVAVVALPTDLSESPEEAAIRLAEQLVARWPTPDTMRDEYQVVLVVDVTHDALGVARGSVWPDAGAFDAQRAQRAAEMGKSAHNLSASDRPGEVACAALRTLDATAYPAWLETPEGQKRLAERIQRRRRSLRSQIERGLPQIRDKRRRVEQRARQLGADAPEFAGRIASELDTLEPMVARVRRAFEEERFAQSLRQLRQVDTHLERLDTDIDRFEVISTDLARKASRLDQVAASFKRLRGADWAGAQAARSAIKQCRSRLALLRKRHREGAGVGELDTERDAIDACIERAADRVADVKSTFRLWMRILPFVLALLLLPSSVAFALVFRDRSSN